MEDFSYSSVIKSHRKDYLLQTSNNVFKNKIIACIFEDGNLISFSEENYPSNILEKDLLTLVKEFHRRKKSELESLLLLSEKFTELNQAEYKNMIGVVYFNNNMFYEAIKEFKDALVLENSLYQVHNNLGKAYMAIQDYDNALIAFENAVKLQSRFADFHNNLGRIYFKKQFCKNAIEQFELALRINPYYGEACFNLGLALLLNAINKENYQLTSDLIKTTTELFEKAAYILSFLKNGQFEKGMEELKADKIEEAFHRFSQLQDTNKKTNIKGFILDFYLKLLDGENEVEISTIWQHIEKLEKLISKHPGYADLYNDLGIAYAILGIYLNNKSIENFEDAIEINPNFATAQKNLKLISNERKGSKLLIERILNLRTKELK